MHALTVYNFRFSHIQPQLPWLKLVLVNLGILHSFLAPGNTVDHDDETMTRLCQAGIIFGPTFAAARNFRKSTETPNIAGTKMINLRHFSVIVALVESRRGPKIDIHLCKYVQY